MVKSFPTKTRRAGRFFGSQSRRSKALRKGRTAGQSSTVGYRLRRYVSILQMRQILLAPWPFQIRQHRKSRANALVQHAPAQRNKRGRGGKFTNRRARSDAPYPCTGHRAVATNAVNSYKLPL